MREVCAFLEDELGLVPGWLLSVPVKVILELALRLLLLVWKSLHVFNNTSFVCRKPKTPLLGQHSGALLCLPVPNHLSQPGKA